MRTIEPSVSFDLAQVKARQKATWESGDFGQVARYNLPAAEEFMARLPLRAGTRVLDVACGTGNLAIIAARTGCVAAGVDIAANLIAQARRRAHEENLPIEFLEGDAEALPYADASFDAVVSMYGVIFAPRPEVIIQELLRVTKRGGTIALANWTPAGFIGQMFDVFKRHLPPQAGLPSPLDWGEPDIVRERFEHGVSELRLVRRFAPLRYPFSPAGTVEFFREYYGPTQRAFAMLGPDAQEALRQDLVELQEFHNLAMEPNETETAAEYLEVQAKRNGR